MRPILLLALLVALCRPQIIPMGAGVNAIVAQTETMKTKLMTSSQISATSTKRYTIPSGGDLSTVDAQSPMPTAGNFRKLFVQLLSDPDSGGSSNGYVFTLQKNHGDTGITVTILSSTTNFQASYSGADVHYAKGDTVSLAFVTSGTPANAPRWTSAIEFQGDLNHESILLGGVISLTGTTATFASLTGDKANGATENQMYTLFPMAATITGLSVRLATVPGSTKDRTFTLRQTTSGTTTAGVLSIGRYVSGLSPTGAAATTCTLGTFNGGGTAATATVALTSTNTIAAGAPIVVTAAGSGYTSAPTSATAADGTATNCAGTAVLVTMVTGDVGTAITYGAAESGVKNVTLSIPVVAGDMFDIRSDSTNTATASVTGFGLLYTPTTNGQFVIPYAAMSATALSTSAVRYVPLYANGGIGITATEVNTQTVTSADFSLNGWTAWLDTHPGGGTKKYTPSLRRNVNPAGTTYATDMTTQGPVTSATTNYPIVADYDLLDTVVTPANTPTAARITMSYIGTVP